MSYPTYDLTLRKLSDMSESRGKRWHNGDLAQWTTLEWTGAMAGEAGEACNAAKKLRRIHLQLPNKSAGLDITETGHLKLKIAKEAADTILYGILVIASLGYDAEDVLRTVFNEKSQEYGFPERI